MDRRKGFSYALAHVLWTPQQMDVSDFFGNIIASIQMHAHCISLTPCWRAPTQRCPSSRAPPAWDRQDTYPVHDSEHWQQQTSLAWPCTQILMLSADRKVQGGSLNQCLLRCHNHLVSGFQGSDGRSPLMNAMKMPCLLSPTRIQGLTTGLLQGFPLAFCFTPVTLCPQEGRQCCSGVQEKWISAHQLCIRVLLQMRTVKSGGSSSSSG